MSLYGKDGYIYISGPEGDDIEKMKVATKAEWSVGWDVAASGKIYQWDKDTLLSAERQAILDEYEALVTGKADLTLDDQEDLILKISIYGSELGKLRFIMDRRSR